MSSAFNQKLSAQPDVNRESSSNTNRIQVVRIVRCGTCNAANLSNPLDSHCWKCEGISINKHFKQHDIKMTQYYQSLRNDVGEHWMESEVVYSSQYGGHEYESGFLSTNTENDQAWPTHGKRINKHRSKAAISDTPSSDDSSSESSDDSSSGSSDESYSDETDLENESADVCSVQTDENANSLIAKRKSPPPPNTPIEYRRYKCTFCNVEMAEDQLVKHQNTYHPEHSLPVSVDQYQLFSISAKCPIEMAANSKEQCVPLATNKIEHIPDQSSSHSTTQPAKLRHKFDIISLTLFQCVICDAVGISEANLRKHHSINHAEIAFDLMNFELFAVENSGKYLKCNSCHTYSARGKERSHEEVCVGRSECVDVSSITQNKTSLRKIYQCKMCANGIEIINLERHRRSKHKHNQNAEDMFRVYRIELYEECPICGVNFGEGRFEVHLQRVHHQSIVHDANIKLPNNSNILKAAADEQAVTKAKVVTDDIDAPTCVSFNDLICNSDSGMNKGNSAICLLTHDNTQYSSVGHHSLDTKTIDPFTGMNVAPNKVVVLTKSGRKSSIATNTTASSKTGPQVECNACGVKVKVNRLTGHMKRVHPKLPHETDIHESLHLKSKAHSDINASANGRITLQLYTCQICGGQEILEQNRLAHAQKHRKTHIESNMFKVSGSTERDQCNICDRIMKSGKLKSHKIRCHSTVRSDDLLQRGRPASKAIGRSTVATKICTTDKVREFTLFTRKLYSCRACGGDGIEVEKFKKHYRHFGTDADNFQVTAIQDVIKCPCNQVFGVGAFVHHMRVHHASIQYCFIRNGHHIFPQYSTAIEISTHKPLDNVIRWFKCHVCWAKNLAENQVKSHHLKQHSTIPLDADIYTVKRVKVRCPICLNIFREKKIESHKKWAHPTMNNVIAVTEYICGICDSVVLDRNMKEHFTKNHNGISLRKGSVKCFANKEKVQCDTCGKRVHAGRDGKHHLKSCLKVNVMQNVLRDEDKQIKKDLNTDKAVYKFSN